MSFSALIARLRGSGPGPEMGAEGPPTNNADAPPADGIIQLSPVRRQGPARRQVPGAGGPLQGAPRQGKDNRGRRSPAPDASLPLGVDPACLVAEGLKMQMFDQQKFKKVLGDGPEPSHSPKTSMVTPVGFQDILTASGGGWCRIRISFLAPQDLEGSQTWK